MLLVDFFIPDDKMIQWLIDYAGGRHIFDIGCGRGLLIEKINQVSHDKAFGIDIYWDNRKPLPIYPMNALDTKLVSHCKNCLVLFCRPCHSDWIERTIDRLPPNIEVLYIGLSKNLFRDFEEYQVEEVRHDGQSRENESVFRVIR